MNIPFSFQAVIEALPGGPAISQALQSAFGAITATWGVQHDANGSHTIITLGSTGGPKLLSGSGSPNTVITAPIGSLYLRTDGGANTTLWIKESGTAATGWTAK